jgi:hypothetical protein
MLTLKQSCGQDSQDDHGRTNEMIGVQLLAQYNDTSNNRNDRCEVLITATCEAGMCDRGIC